MVEFILESNGERLILPINPATTSSPVENNNTVVDVVGIGEIVIPGSAKLSQRTLESRFPRTRPDWINAADFKPPNEYSKLIRKWQRTKSIIKYTVTGLNQTGLDVVVERFDTERRGGEHEDMYYTLELKEYRPYGATLLQAGLKNTVTPTLPQRTNVNKPAVPRVYKVVKNDCLWSIAQRLSGDGSRWREMYNINRDIIGGDQVIYVGNELKIPESWVTS